MKIYNNRKDAKYLSRLNEAFDIESLKKHAISLPKPRIIKSKEFSKFIRIDILGFTASTLLDASNMLDKNNIYSKFRKLLLMNNELQKEGIFIKVRFLMEYPFSTSAYSKIQAETTNHRSSINEPSYSRNFELLELLDEDSFGMSLSVVLQKANLNHLQDLEKELREKFQWNSSDNPSSITLKFSPIGSGSCILIINNILFYDTYLYSKFDRRDNKLSLHAPVVELEKSGNENAFKSFEDHFRYFWELDTTLDCDDATYYQKNKFGSLKKFRSPNAINFEAKAKRICNLKGICNDDKTINSWQKQVSNQFQRLCADLSPTVANETIFITCSWEKDKDDISSPNKYAKLLNKYLQEDFTKIDVPIFSVKIMEATPSEFLSNQLYQTLDSSTVGLVLMTKDIKIKYDNNKEEYHCKPNVYHELGYLMKQLAKKRMLILKEQEVVPPSNIQDVIRFDFQTDKMIFRYHDILEQLNAITNIPNSVLYEAVDNHVKRLDCFLQDGVISSDEFKALKSKVLQLKNKKQ